jgi:hypothetical protein
LAPPSPRPGLPAPRGPRGSKIPKLRLPPPRGASTRHPPTTLPRRSNKKGRGRPLEPPRGGWPLLPPPPQRALRAPLPPPLAPPTRGPRGEPRPREK